MLVLSLVRSLVLHPVVKILSKIPFVPSDAAAVNTGRTITIS